MSITLTMTHATVTVVDGTAVLTASVTNDGGAPARIVLGAFGPTDQATDAGAPAGPALSAAGWTDIDRPLREVPAGASEQYRVTFTPPEGTPPGSHPVRFIAYSADQAPEEHADRARQVDVIVPAVPVVAPPPKKPWWPWAAAALALLLVVGAVAFLVLRGEPVPADTPSPPPPSSPVESPLPLNGTPWTLTQFEDGTLPVAGTKVSLVFQPGRVSGRACNSFQGPVTISGDKITVGALTSTLMFCVAEGVMDQERRVFSTLGDATTVTVVGSTLTLRTDDGRSLTFAAP
ncbi:META domain-containing protein [Aestuariimicrobium sp. Y1814]|uniref:META domain-containing protein n=1 Tax=Aestuariimicrobium sp. Y1814 TaxID=3418742 RepID=UPI003DA7091A